MKTLITSRALPQDPEAYGRLVFEVLGYDEAKGEMTLKGKFNHVFNLPVAYARKHYQPVKENDHAVLKELREKVRRGREDRGGTGGEQGQRAETSSAETGSEEGVSEAG